MSIAIDNEMVLNHTLNVMMLEGNFHTLRRLEPAFRMLPEPTWTFSDPESPFSATMAFDTSELSEEALEPLLSKVATFMGEPAGRERTTWRDITGEEHEGITLHLNGLNSRMFYDYMIQRIEADPTFFETLPPAPKLRPQPTFEVSDTRLLAPLRQRASDIFKPKTMTNAATLAKVGAFMNYLQSAGTVRADLGMEVGSGTNSAEGEENVTVTFGGYEMKPYQDSQTGLRDDFASMNQLCEKLLGVEDALSQTNGSYYPPANSASEAAIYSGIFINNDTLKLITQFVDKNPRLMEAFKLYKPDITIHPGITSDTDRIMSRHQPASAQQI